MASRAQVMAAHEAMLAAHEDHALAVKEHAERTAALGVYFGTPPASRKVDEWLSDQPSHVVLFLRLQGLV